VTDVRWGDEWRYYHRTAPRKVKDGIRTRSRYGEIGKSWWSRRWLDTLGSYGWSNRLERGKRYARLGQVVKFKLSEGRVESLVQGSQRKPYHVTIEVKPLPAASWKRVTASMGAKAVFASKLLAGEMPVNVEEAFSFSSTTLFPTKREIRMDCSCPDIANPCKHIAAVHYILAEEFDRDPFMMFLLRGKTKEDLLAALRQGRKVTAARGTDEPGSVAGSGPDRPKAPPPLEELIPTFWSEQKPLGHLGVSPSGPYVNAAVIRRLGEPPFWREPEDFNKLMEAIYENVTSKALKLAFS
jgi:uncharacterized Zn finger protein